MKIGTRIAMTALGIVLLCLAVAGVFYLTAQRPVEAVYHFDSCGGESVPSQTVPAGETPLRPYPAPVREGYEFAGWYADETYTREFDFGRIAKGREPKEVWVYARWTRECTVRFDAVGGSQVPDQHVTEGGYLRKPVCTYKDNLYALEGWYRDAEYKTKWDFETDSVHGDITLYAKWNTNVKVSFDAMGGSKVDFQMVTKGNKVTRPKDPAYAGYTFAGWYSDKECKTEWNFDTAVEAEITLYAKWEVKNTYTVTFNTMGGSEVAEIADVLPDTTIEKPEDPVYEGYIFEGWYKDVSRTKKWDFAKDAVKLDMTLYALWTADFTVTFDSVGGSEVEPILHVGENKKIKKPADPVLDRHKFEGWFKDKEYTQAWDFKKDGVNSNMTLYAKWQFEGFIVGFDIGTDTGTGTITGIKPGSLIARPIDPTKEGFSFMGWYRDEAMEQRFNFYTDGVNEDMTLRAKWSEGTVYTVTCISDGKTVDVLYSDGGAVLLPTPVGEGVFAGWFDAETEGNLIGASGGEYTPEESITLYAQWTAEDSAEGEEPETGETGEDEVGEEE